MIIYIEGVDGSGKTTLANKLTTRLNQLAPLKKIKVVPDGESMISTRPDLPGRLSKADLIITMDKMANSTDTVYICDRGPISDIIYRMFDDEEPVLTLEAFWTFWLVHTQSMVVVHCDTDNSNRLMLSRGENNPVSIQHHKTIRAIYNELMPFFGAIKYDITDAPDNLDIINTILSRLWQGRDRHQNLMSILKGDQHEQ